MQRSLRFGCRSVFFPTTHLSLNDVEVGGFQGQNSELMPLFCFQWPRGVFLFPVEINWTLNFLNLHISFGEADWPRPLAGARISPDMNQQTAVVKTCGSFIQPVYSRKPKLKRDVSD